MSDAPEAGGFLHILPMHVPTGMTMTAISASLLPWVAPSYLGVVGVTEADGSPVLAATFELPHSWLRTREEVPPFEREWIYIRRFSTDMALATGAHAFANVRPGNNPPDALADNDHGTVGVESTVLTIEDRRGVHGLFQRLRQQLIAQEPAAFARLAGHMIYVWFTDQTTGELAKPFRHSEADAITYLLRELASYEPRAEQMWVPGPLPQVAPELPIGATSAGASFYATPIVGAAPGSLLFTVMGFEIGLAYTSFITASAAWTIVQKLTEDHDKPGVDLLLISAGAPDRLGNIYPVEDSLAQFLVDHPIGISRPPVHIREVLLHSWARGSAFSLYPEISPLFGPIFKSMVPVHHPV